jgi:hypothetical protein
MGHPSDPLYLRQSRKRMDRLLHGLLSVGMESFIRRLIQLLLPAPERFNGGFRTCYDIRDAGGEGCF